MLGRRWRKGLLWGLLFVAVALVGGACHQTVVQVERHDGAVQITHAMPWSAQNPVFAPDDASVVYTRFRNGYNLGPSELVRVNRDGTEERVLVSPADADNVNVPFGSWVRHRICFSSDRAGGADEIWMINDDGSHLTQLTFHDEDEDVYYIEPVFNPQDPRWIAFEYVRGENDAEAIHQIALLEVASGTVTLLTDGTYDDRLPSWSNDGRHILFQRNEYGRDEGWKVYVADIIADIDVMALQPLSNVRTISHGTSDDTDSSWSYDDRYVLSSSNYGGLPVPNIFMFPVDAAHPPIRRTFNQSFEDGAPSQSHDGKWIAFESHYGESEEQPSEIWIVGVQ